MVKGGKTQVKRKETKCRHFLEPVPAGRIKLFRGVQMTLRDWVHAAGLVLTRGLLGRRGAGSGKAPDPAQGSGHGHL
jgi:hypothetical protein